MELKLNDYKLPEKILFNYEELKQELQEKVSFYETLVYTDDQIKLAKADKANLNKLKKALNDERIRLEREYLEPFNDFKNKINEIIKIIDKPVVAIDKQVKSYEEQKRAEKIAQVKEYFESLEKPEWLTFEQIVQDKWGNATTSMKFIQESILVIMTNIQESLATLSKLPEFGFEATEVYKSTLDINKALNEGKRLAEIARAKAEHEAKLKAEAEAKAVEETTKKSEAVPEPQKIQYEKPEVKQWVSFTALLSTEDAFALKKFLDNLNLES